jgi:hypothetical protein
MSSTLPPLPARSHANPLRTIETSREASIAAVKGAMADIGLSQKAFAITAKQPESVICEALSLTGTRHLATEWIHAQDDAFIDAWTERVRRQRTLEEARELDDRADRILGMIEFLVQQRRPRKAVAA